MDNAVITITKATAQHMVGTVTNVARKVISLAYAEEQEGSPEEEWHPQCQRG